MQGAAGDASDLSEIVIKQESGSGLVCEQGNAVVLEFPKFGW